MHRACVALALILAAAVPARAGGLVIVGGSPRAIGRAGTGTVGEDGGGALLVNPAAIARREATRIQLGVAFVDDAIAWTSDDPAAPVARDQAGSATLPLVALVTVVGGWVIGAGMMTSGASERALRDPRDVPRPEDLGPAFGYRYAGIAGATRRDTVTLGVARRLGEAVAVGVAVSASRLTVRETRRLWAGFAGISAIGDPRRDVQLAFAGRDRLVPGAVAGVLIAPVDTPLELGASLGWTARGAIEADVAGAGTLDGPRLALSAPHATLAVRQPLAARVGVRYLGERVTVELGADLWIAAPGAREASWHLDGVQVIDASSFAAAIDRVPSRLTRRTHGAARGALEVELIAGFLWATAGYAFTVGETAAARLAPSLGDLGGHTLGLGVEGTAGGFTYTIGWARTFARARRGGEASLHDNPFGAGDAPVASGRFDGSVDQLGVLLDLEL